MKKYKILYDSELIIHKHVLHRIEACCTFRTFQGSLVREGEDEICVSNGYTYRLEDYLNMLNNQSFNKERDILLLAKKY